jgi:hypothetical protein
MPRRCGRPSNGRPQPIAPTSTSKTATWSAILGYKALNVDYSQGSGLTLYNFDMTIHGPIFGVTARF